MAWDISQFAYDSVGFGPSGSDLSSGLYVKSDGTGFYTVADPNTPIQNRVIQCSMSTPWDLSTAANVSTFNLTTSVFHANEGIFFKDDGLKMYVIQQDFNATHYVNEHALSVAWDVTTAVSTATFSIQAQIPAIATRSGLFFKDDGLKMYVTSTANGTIYQYSLSSAWDVTSASFSTSFDASAQLSGVQGIFIKPDGTKFYAASLGYIWQYSFGTAWDISSLSYDSLNLSLSSPPDGGVALSIKSTGDKLFILGVTEGGVYQFSGPGIPVVTVNENVSLSFQDTSGNVQLLNAGKTDNTSAINYELETQDIEFGNRFHLKKAADKIIAFAKGNVDDALEVSQNGVTKPIPMTLTNRVNVGKDVNLEGNYFSFKWYGNTSTNQPLFEGIQLEDVTDLGMTTG